MDCLKRNQARTPMQKYELLYIVPAQYTDTEIISIQETVTALVEKTGGKIIRNEILGKIKLAYTINKVQHGSYILVYFDADGSEIAELDRLLRLSDEVLRHTIVDRPEGVEETQFELSDYIAPLTPEGKRVMPKTKEVSIKEPKPTPIVTPAPEKVEDTKTEEKVEEKVEDKTEAIAPPAPSDKTAEESKMTMQELDQQLDKILEGDIGDNI